MANYKNLFMRHMDRNDIKYTDVKENVVKVSYTGDNLQTIPIYVFFDKDGDPLVSFKCWNIANFKGKEAAAKTLREASQMVVDFIRRVSWHDAKTPPPVHDESWENAGEKHCCIMSELVWVCCESRNTMKGWIENGKWYIEDGRQAADTPYGAVKFWAPLLEPPEVVK